MLWDLDPQGEAGFLLHTKPKVKGGSIAVITGHRDLEDAVRSTDVPGLDLLPADLSLGASEQAWPTRSVPAGSSLGCSRQCRTDYDVAILDCPPGVSGLALNTFHAVDIVLLPLIPSPLLGCTRFFSMVDACKRLHREIRAELMRRTTRVLTGAVPASSVVERMGLTRVPVVLSDPRTLAAAAYRVIGAEIAGLLA